MDDISGTTVQFLPFYYNIIFYMWKLTFQTNLLNKFDLILINFNLQIMTLGEFWVVVKVALFVDNTVLYIVHY